MTQSVIPETVPRISSQLTFHDIIGAWRVRWGLGRDAFAVAPGLYALGSPHSLSPVLVSANYKMSFDILRSRLKGYDAWLLVLDTVGVNVWCAAGKGSFGTTELIGRIQKSELAKVVQHRQVIVPQLGAVGVAAHEVREATGFRVIYGPVAAKDLPAFIEAGMKATPAMRRKHFPLSERLVLIPMELLPALKLSFLPLLVVLFLGGWETLGDGRYWENLFQRAPLSITSLMLAIVGGAVLTPLLLPFLPFRAFSLKGAVVGVFACALVLIAWWGGFLFPSSVGEIVGWCFVIVALSSFLAMNFTGASTYTSLSGVKKEMGVALPLQIAAGVGGILLWLLARFIG